MKATYISKQALALATALGLGPAATSQASTIVLDFEGLGDSEWVGNFYGGGTGSLGSGPGPSYGIEFSDNALALVDSDAGGSGNIGGEPSGNTAMVFLTGSAATLNYAAGFTSLVSFYYSAPFTSGSITVYDGENATGNVLATLFLPVTPVDGGDPTGAYSPFIPLGVLFDGTAKSIDFSGTQDYIAFDDITFETDDLDDEDLDDEDFDEEDFDEEEYEAVPEGGTSLALFGLSLAGLVGVSRRSKRNRA